VAALSLLAQFAPVTPESPNAEGIRDSYLFVTIFTFGIFLLVEGLLIAFIWRYRRQKRPRFEDAAQVHGATRLELAWTAFPVVVLFFIAAFVFIALPGIKDVPEAAAGAERLEIEVTGRQF
jgi:cytochrome c oxidase subunit II